MKVIVALQVDLETTPLGTRSRLAEPFRGIPLLCLTIESAKQVKGVDRVHVLCPIAQEARCNKLLEGASVQIHTHDAPPPPWAQLVRTSRKWSLDGWRGGIGQTVWFDEFVDCRVLAGLLSAVEADAVLAVPPAAPFFDPQFAEKMIRQRTEAADEMRLVFSATPPGIAGVILDASLIRELAEKNVPLSWLFTYQPDQPRRDLIFQACCCEAPAPLRFAASRLCADTDRSAARLNMLCDRLSPMWGRLSSRSGDDLVRGAQTPQLGLPELGSHLIEIENEYVEPLPREVEIELTTESPYPDALLRPSRDQFPSRGPIDPGVVARAVAEMTEFDDSLVVLGGFGDPLRHREFVSILKMIRSAGATNEVYGLAVRTYGVDLTDEHIVALIENRVDLLEVVLDAWTAETYARLQSPSGRNASNLEHVRNRLNRVEELRQERASVFPLIVPAFTKARENVYEMDAFYDGWVRKVGAAGITGYSHRAGQCEDRAVMSMSPAVRTPCRRIQSRCVVLADGSVTICDQDFAGRHVIGSLKDRSLASIWRDHQFEKLRLDHAARRFDAHPLCATCDEWHRP